MQHLVSSNQEYQKLVAQVDAARSRFDRSDSSLIVFDLTGTKQSILADSNWGLRQSFVGSDLYQMMIKATPDDSKIYFTGPNAAQGVFNPVTRELFLYQGDSSDAHLGVVIHYSGNTDPSYVRLSSLGDLLAFKKGGEEFVELLVG
jgi:hypothetical protein